MLRETHVSLPYHRPKQRTLEEFLNRKKGTPEIIQSLKIQSFTPEDDKLLRERQKQLEEFYKNEEDDQDEEEDDEDYKPEEDETNVAEPGTQSSFQVPDVTGEPGTESVPAVAVTDGQATVACQENTQTDLVDKLEETKIEPEKEKEPLNLGEAVDLDLQEEMDQTTVDPSQPTESESLKLMLNETPILESSVSEPMKPLDKKLLKLEALKKQIDSSLLERTLNITPKLGSGADDDLFSPAAPEISSGAQKLMSRFVTHAQATGAPGLLKDRTRDEELSIVTKRINSEGVEVLATEKVDYKPKPTQKNEAKRIGYLSLKEKMKEEMFKKKREELRQKEELMKLHKEENEEELPEEELMDEDVLEDEEEEIDEDEEGESEPEENDIVMKEKKTKRGLFFDDEAEESGGEAEGSGDEYERDESEADESDAESLNLVQEDDDDEIDEITGSRKKKSGFKKIKNAAFLSDDESNPAPQLLETPNLETSSVRSVAGSTHSDASSVFNSAPRWTPFKDRINSDGVEILPGGGAAGSIWRQDEQDSPTASQMAKKKLGFEGIDDTYV